jgi:hypothetical protein
LSDAKNRKTGLRCQLGREVEVGVAMSWAGIFRENRAAFNARVSPDSCSCSKGKQIEHEQEQEHDYEQAA